MEEERLLVLRMVADGKITAEEAAALLRALDATRGTTERAPGPGGKDMAFDVDRLGRKLGEKAELMAEAIAGEVEKHAADAEKLGRKLEDKAESMAQAIAEKVEEHVTRLEKRVEDPGWLQGLLGGLNLGHMFGQQHRFEDTITGSFEHEGDVQLDISTFNGRIELETWDRPGFEFRVVKTIRAPHVEEAAELAGKLVHFTREGSQLKLDARSPGPWNAGVAIYARLPAERAYEANLGTTNGRVVMSGLRAGNLSARATNGRVVVERVAVAKHADLKTTNGKIEFQGSTPHLVARTSNGRIVVSPNPGQGGDYDLSTSNGSIRVQLVASPDTGYDVKAVTTNAKIVADLGDMEMLSEEKRHGRQHLHARTQGFEDRRHWVRVRAQTSNGPIRIGPGLE